VPPRVRVLARVQMQQRVEPRSALATTVCSRACSQLLLEQPRTLSPAGLPVKFFTVTTIDCCRQNF